MYHHKVLFVCFCVVYSQHKLEDEFDSIENGFEEVGNFLRENETDKTVAFSPFNYEIAQRMGSYVASYENQNSTGKKFSSIEELLESIETDKSLFIYNEFRSGQDRVLDLRAGKNKVKREGIPASSINKFEKNLRSKSDFKNIKIDSCRSLLQFNGNLKHIFDKLKTHEKTFKTGNNEEVRRDFMSASRLIKVCSIKVEGKKFYVTILPYNVKQSQRHLVHLIPMEDGIDLKKLWSKFCKVIDFNFNKLMNLCDEKHVKLTIPIIENFKSCLTTKLCLKSDENLKFDYVQENYLNINEGNLFPMKTTRERHLDVLPILKIEITAIRPYIAFVYDSELDKIICVLKDTGKQ
ncbi:hypothetical protein NBO_13g0021 [Nosema bombycis CQ1]|uniref:Serpin domain-containing protein n=1 Tax=Nosema bombycis (strain CQ1 / CVCC 102059) TaxID=578461 RepID=R0MA60_NOSB1|nr:hypothetical protein NBO_13g0021 [Nosema bombycis CQ1]|eukprot:EOB14844.1 hypothetical protein NBO_13g0021 [Nosema bombycis CQ1]